MNDISRLPSGYRIESALAAWHATRERLLIEDPTLENDEAALIDLLGPEEGDIQDVLARLLRGAVHAEAMADAAKERISDMKARQDRYEARAQAMRGTAFAVLDAIGMKRVELADLTASVRSGSPSVVVTDLDAVPDIYVETVVTRKPDKRTLLAVMKSGAAVDGCELTNAMPSLSIRVK